MACKGGGEPFSNTAQDGINRDGKPLREPVLNCTKGVCITPDNFVAALCGGKNENGSGRFVVDRILTIEEPSVSFPGRKTLKARGGLWWFLQWKFDVLIHGIRNHFWPCEAFGASRKLPCGFSFFASWRGWLRRSHSSLAVLPCL